MRYWAAVAPNPVWAAFSGPRVPVDTGWQVYKERARDARPLSVSFSQSPDLSSARFYLSSYDLPRSSRLLFSQSLLLLATR